MYEFLCSFSPTDAGRYVTHRVRRGRKYSVGRIRLYIPTDNDKAESSYWGYGDGYYLIGRRFAERFVRVSEQYVLADGKLGVVVGRDAIDAVKDFLGAAWGILPDETCLRLGERFGVSRGFLAELVGPWGVVHVVKRCGSSKRGMTVLLSDPFA